MAFAYFKRYTAIKTYRDEVAALEDRAASLNRQKTLRGRMEEQIRSAANNYVKEKVETLELLKDEKLRVAALAKQFPDNAFLKERLLFLESDQNQIQFVEERAGKDLHLRLSHRVQMGLGDLKRFLETLEGDRYDPTQHKPFLIIKKFDLLKCYEKGDEKVYSIHTEILQKL